jgi:hypothetical protein
VVRLTSTLGVGVKKTFMPFPNAVQEEKMDKTPLEPKVTGCMMHAEGRCYRDYTFFFIVDFRR